MTTGTMSRKWCGCWAGRSRTGWRYVHRCWFHRLMWDLRDRPEDPGALSLYIMPSGSDNNDGRTPETSVVTVGRAIDIANENGGNVIIYLM